METSERNYSSIQDSLASAAEMGFSFGPVGDEVSIDNEHAPPMTSDLTTTFNMDYGIKHKNDVHGRGQGGRRTVSVDHQHRRLLSQILLIAHCLPHRSSLECATRVPLLRLRGCRMQRVQREPRKWLEEGGANSTVSGVGLVRGARGRPEGQICAQHQQVSGTVCRIFYANNHTNKHRLFTCLPIAPSLFASIVSHLDFQFNL